MSAKKIVTPILILIGFAALILLVTFWSRFTSFYKDCMKIHEGMNAAEAEEIMRSYIESDKYAHTREDGQDGPALYVGSNSSGDECAWSTKDGVVTKLLHRFEP